MSDKGRINILEDITIKSSNAKNQISTGQLYSSVPILEHLYQENIFNTDCTTVDIKKKLRHTASMDLFEEEPVFSDSEDEREFTRRVLESQNISLVSNEKPKRISIEVQCDLPICDMQILDFVEKCSKLNSEEVNGEFKELIHLCRRLNDKRRSVIPALWENQENTFNQITALNPQEVPNLNSKISAEFLPSRQGSDDFLSESFNDQLGCSELRCLSINKKSVEAVNGNSEKCSTEITKPDLPPRYLQSAKINKNTTLHSKDRLEKETEKEQPARKRRKLAGNSTQECVSHKSSAEHDVHTIKPVLRRSPRLRRLKDPENMSLKHKLRRLYSPTQWILSKEFASLCEKS